MNKLLLLHANRLKDCFEKYGKFDFNKEMAQELYKIGIKPENFHEEENFYKIYRIFFRITPTLPYFEFVNGKPVLKSKYFEIVRYAQAVASFIRGVSQFLAAKDFSETSHQQFIIFAFYQSIFHFITSFLNLHGTIYCPKVVTPNFQVKKLKEFNGGKNRELIHLHSDWNEYILGTFSIKKKEWSFTKIGLKHIDRWKRFSDYLKLYLSNGWGNQIPNDVKRFFGYMRAINEYKKNYWRDDIKEYKIDLDDKSLKENLSFYSEPCNIRNQKIYENRLYDAFSEAYLSKGEKPPSDLIMAEQSFFRDFSKSLMIWQYHNLKEYLEYVESKCSPKTFDRGINAIIETPLLSIYSFLFTDIYSDRVLHKIKPSIQEFIALFLFNIDNSLHRAVYFE